MPPGPCAAPARGAAACALRKAGLRRRPLSRPRVSGAEEQPARRARTAPVTSGALRRALTVTHKLLQKGLLDLSIEHTD